LFLTIFTTEAVGSHNYQRTYSLLFDWQGELLLPLTDILFVYLPSDSWLCKKITNILDNDANTKN
jgi:hypothetical protein